MYTIEVVPVKEKSAIAKFIFQIATPDRPDREVGMVPQKGNLRNLVEKSIFGC